MKRTGILVSILAVLLFAASAHAQAPKQGGYFGAGYGSVWSDAPSEIGGLGTDDTAGGGKIFAGTMFDDRWGLEFALHHLGKFDVESLGTKTDEFETTAISVAGVLSVPVSASYYFNARLGLAFTNAEYDCIVGCSPPVFTDRYRRGLSGMFGIGMSARIGQSAVVRLDFDHFGKVHYATGLFEFEKSIDVFSVNLLLTF